MTDNIQPKQGEQVIISMTSFPQAITYAVGALKTLLRGSVMPDKLILYLTFSQFGDEGIPAELREMERQYPVFEVRNYDSEIRSYRKLIPALKDFPDATIVTVDDDVVYHRHMLRNLLRWHKRFPGTVIAHRARRINLSARYRKWKKYRWYHFLFKRIKPAFNNLQTGVGGVLYPPHCLKAEMMDENLFRTIAPTTDDLWFWAAGIANNVPVLPVPFGFNKPKDLGKPRQFALKCENFKAGTDKNSAIINKILEHYPEIKERACLDPASAKRDIDLVYLWVNGNDPKWQAKHDDFTGQSRGQGVDCKGRYADNDELKYSLRSIEKYAPWIRKIFIVTDNQVPEWLNIDNPKIRIVDHKEIMPAECLPCFNSRIIEHHLHKIPDLSERFLYANDDMMLNKPVEPSDFFAADGLPIIRMNMHLMRKAQLFIKQHLLGKKLTNYKLALHNTALLVESRYGKYIGSRTHHNIDANLKSNHARAYNVFAPEIQATLTNHLRAENDVQRNIYAYVALLEHRGHRKYVNQHTSFRFFIDNARKYDKFGRYNPTFFCMNDSEYASDSDRKRAAEFLRRLFPDKSAFEK